MSDDKVFDPKKWKKLESDERRERMNPEKLRRFLDLKGDETVLDIGCGTGFFAETLAPCCSRLIGVDQSDLMLDMFRGKPIFKTLDNVELLVGSADKIPVADGCVDVALHTCLLHEVPDVTAFHAEILRLLKPGGKLVAIDWRAKQTEGGPPLEHRVSEDRAKEWMVRDGFVEVSSFSLYDDQYSLGGYRPD